MTGTTEKDEPTAIRKRTQIGINFHLARNKSNLEFRNVFPALVERSVKSCSAGPMFGEFVFDDITDFFVDDIIDGLIDILVD